MEIQDLQKKELKSVIITVRTTQENSEWLKEKKVSPTMLFNKAVEELRKENEN